MGRPDAGHSNVGASLAGLLVTVFLLGGLVAGAISIAESRASRGSVGSKHVDSAGAARTVPTDFPSVIGAAAQAACRTNFRTVVDAVATYEAVNGHPPASMASLGAALEAQSRSPYFTLTIGPNGAVEVAAGGHPASPGSGNCAYAG